MTSQRTPVAKQARVSCDAARPSPLKGARALIANKRRRSADGVGIQSWLKQLLQGLRVIGCSVGGALAPISVTGQVTFAPETVFSAPAQPGFGTGVSAFDYDRDGDVDLFVPTATGQPNALLQRQANGLFTDVAATVGLADTRAARAALWVDFDNDGDFDLLLARDCYGRVCDATPILSFYRHDPGGQFVDITASIGLTLPTSTLDNNDHIGGLSAGDLNGDGLADIYLPIWGGQPIVLFSVPPTVVARPNDQGDDAISPFVLAGQSSGIGAVSAGHWQGMIHDFNNDQRLDLFVNVDFIANQLWLNQGDGQFVDQAVQAGVDSAWNEMGLAAGDYDRDGDIDLFVSNIYGWSTGERVNLLYRNQTNGSNVSFDNQAIGLSVDDAGWGWGATWLDVENDGDLDLAVTNGYCQPDYCGSAHQTDRSRLFINPGDGSPFVDASDVSGFNDSDRGSTLVAADIDDDGRLDLVQSAVDLEGNQLVRVWRNQTPDAGPFTRFAIDSPHAAGAVVRLSDNTGRRAELMTLGSSFMGQQPLVAHYGLGSTAGLVSAEVTWPGGQRSWLGTHPVNKLIDRTRVVDRSFVFFDNFE